MQKVVSITQCANGLQKGIRPVPQQGSRQVGDRLDAGKGIGRRGILLEFPRISQGPLFAAAVALLAIAGIIAPAVQV